MRRAKVRSPGTGTGPGGGGDHARPAITALPHAVKNSTRTGARTPGLTSWLWPAGVGMTAISRWRAAAIDGSIYGTYDSV